MVNVLSAGKTGVRFMFLQKNIIFCKKVIFPSYNDRGEVVQLLHGDDLFFCSKKLKL
jgi:hypothetical protein